MQVRAIMCGYLGQYREIGDVFEIESEKLFSKVWMEKISDGESEALEASDDSLDQSSEKSKEPKGKASKGRKSQES